MVLRKFSAQSQTKLVALDVNQARGRLNPENFVRPDSFFLTAITFLISRNANSALRSRARRLAYDREYATGNVDRLQQKASETQPNASPALADFHTCSGSSVRPRKKNEESLERLA
jgi:hypothetical protein